MHEAQTEREAIIALCRTPDAIAGSREPTAALEYYQREIHNESVLRFLREVGELPSEETARRLNSLASSQGIYNCSLVDEMERRVARHSLVPPQEDEPR